MRNSQALFSPQPLVSIGVPAYNRAEMLARTLESLTKQTYKNLEIIISDNASTDQTPDICARYQNDPRVKYIRQPENIGGTANFRFVLGQTSGPYYMWMADDDWLDLDYIDRCMERHIRNPELSLVSGIGRYYDNGQFRYGAKSFQVRSKIPLFRMLKYYFSVANSTNELFYGIYKREQILRAPMLNWLAGDWFMIAAVLFFGPAEMIDSTCVHRSLGGVSENNKKTCQAFGLPTICATFLYSTIIWGMIRSIWMMKTGRSPVNDIVTKLTYSITIAFELMAIRALILIKKLPTIPRRIFHKFRRSALSASTT